ncbi:hypothetical protein LEP1GSC032_2786 [Leptospira interrogans str. 2002000631]|nr:hypothetical protein LEP1GSC032_2786 [Leptospira interrogans str. 2002000631]
MLFLKLNVISQTQCYFPNSMLFPELNKTLSINRVLKHN